MSAIRFAYLGILSAAFASGLMISLAHAGDDLGTVFANGRTLDQAVLADQRGGKADADATATVTGNVATFDACTISCTGANTVADQAFANAQGVFTVMQNSGNNVAMQSQTVFNINLH